MARMRRGQVISAFACLLAIGFLASGCGDDSDSSTSSTAAVENRPAPPKSDFPSAQGKTLDEVVNLADGPSELVVAPAAQTFYKGVNRYPFGVFEADRTQIPDAEVALYFAKVPRVRKGAGDGDDKGAVARARDEALKAPAVGPFPASIEPLVTQPAFRAMTTSDDPDAATVVYSTEVNFPSDGEWRIVALVKRDGELSASLLSSAVVGQFKKVPRVGQRAPLIHTPTPSDVGGDLAQITTRIPPDTQNQVDFADVLGREPILLLFATPQFCQSRVCGPVVDVAEQVKQLYGDRAAFIHMEIFNDNDPAEDPRPQVRAFHLPSEPWLFAIDRDGIIKAEVEGAFGVDLMTKAVKEAIGE